MWNEVIKRRSNGRAVARRVQDGQRTGIQIRRSRYRMELVCVCTIAYMAHSWRAVGRTDCDPDVYGQI